MELFCTVDCKEALYQKVRIYKSTTVYSPRRNWDSAHTVHYTKYFIASALLLSRDAAGVTYLLVNKPIAPTCPPPPPPHPRAVRQGGVPEGKGEMGDKISRGGGREGVRSRERDEPMD
jgi:hypothetical protein